MLVMDFTADVDSIGCHVEYGHWVVLNIKMVQGSNVTFFSKIFIRFEMELKYEYWQ